MNTAYFVGKRRCISELSPWRRWLVRFAYRRTGWASDYSVETVGIFTDKESAIEAASIPGGFYNELPVNGSLPDTPVQFRDHQFPLSDHPIQNAQRFIAISRAELRNGLKEIDQGLERVVTLTTVAGR